VKDTIRTTVEQNLVLRWVSEADLPNLYEELKAASLAAPGAGTIVDVAACPGTDTCKLGISSSRGLASELRSRFAARAAEMPEAVRGLRVKISGCFNSCGQHHVAELGFYGVNRNKNGYAVPHFQVVLGGQWSENAAAYGLAIGAVPSKRIPEAVDLITGRFVAERQESETFQAFIKRIGKAECKKMLDPLGAVPPHEQDSSYYMDWHDAREYTLGDMGVGECAGEVVSPIEFELAACEREVFEAQLQLDHGQITEAARSAYATMLHGALALLQFKNAGFPKDPDSVVTRFKELFYDTQLFFDPFVGGNFAGYFFRAHERSADSYSAEQVHQLVEEAQLFIEACHSCHARMIAKPAMATA
jgi:sulfite reductase (ferredoxin)